MRGVFFVEKKWTFPQRRVHYVQYQYFLFYILLIWEGAYAPNAPPAYGPAGLQLGDSVTRRVHWPFASATRIIGCSETGAVCAQPAVRAAAVNGPLQCNTGWNSSRP